MGGAEVPPPGPWNCIVAATAERYVETPLFFLQSRFDHFQLGAELALPSRVKKYGTLIAKPELLHLPQHGKA